MKVMLSLSLFCLGLLCGFVIHVVMSQSSPTTSEHPNLKSPRGLDDVLLNSTKGWMPEIATLMSESRSLDGVVYLLNQDRARRLVDTYAVFEAMLMDPDVKGPSLCFWTDEAQHKFRNVSYFPVPLGTDFPFMDVTEPEGKDESSVLVVRYRARIRSTLAGIFYLEDQTLLGYAYMPVTDAQHLSDMAKEKAQMAEP